MGVSASLERKLSLERGKRGRPWRLLAIHSAYAYVLRRLAEPPGRRDAPCSMAAWKGCGGTESGGSAGGGRGDHGANLEGIARSRGSCESHSPSAQLHKLPLASARETRFGLSAYNCAYASVMLVDQDQKNRRSYSSPGWLQSRSFKHGLLHLPAAQEHRRQETAVAAAPVAAAPVVAPDDEVAERRGSGREAAPLEGWIHAKN